MAKPVGPAHLLECLVGITTEGDNGPARTRAVAPSLGDRVWVLVADDNDINQLVVRGLSSAQGFHADIARDGREAAAFAPRGTTRLSSWTARRPGWTASARLWSCAAGKAPPGHIADALDTGRLDARRRAAPDLVGMTGSIGASELTRLGTDLQECGRSKNLDAAPALVARIQTEFQHVRRELLDLATTTTTTLSAGQHDQPRASPDADNPT